MLPGHQGDIYRHLSSRPYAQVGDGVVPGVVADKEMNGRLLLVTKKLTLGNSLKVQGLGLAAFTAEAQVQSLVRELRSQKAMQSDEKKRKTKDNKVHTHNRHGLKWSKGGRHYRFCCLWYILSNG